MSNKQIEPLVMNPDFGPVYLIKKRDKKKRLSRDFCKKPSMFKKLKSCKSTET